MNSDNAILGTVKLFNNLKSMPEGGLAISKHRVELADKEKPDENWIAEINVLGTLPWNEGEERQVEIRIMSQEFKDYVLSKRPQLSVLRGDEVLGDVEIAE